MGKQLSDCGQVPVGRQLFGVLLASDFPGAIWMHKSLPGICSLDHTLSSRVVVGKYSFSSLSYSMMGRGISSKFRQFQTYL